MQPLLSWNVWLHLLKISGHVRGKRQAKGHSCQPQCYSPMVTQLQADRLQDGQQSFPFWGGTKSESTLTALRDRRTDTMPHTLRGMGLHSISSPLGYFPVRDFYVKAHLKVHTPEEFTKLKLWFGQQGKEDNCPK